MNDTEHHIHLHLISDATGETTHFMARAALARFPEVKATEHVWTLVRTFDHLIAIEKSIAETGGVVLFSIADVKIREEVESICERNKVPMLSILDHALHVLSKALGKSPQAVAGGQYRMDEAYFNRMEALEFAIHHDDGQAMATLGAAEILLVGISRSSKTPTSIYLANRGYKVANYPLVPGVDPPLDTINQVDLLVVGLIKDARHLAHIRRNRLAAMNEDTAIDYADPRKISEEIAAARKLFQSQNWPMIDVTRSSVEETAAAVINLFNKWQGERKS